MLSNILEVGESSFDMTSTLIGMQVDGLYHESDRPAYVCTLEELRKNTMNVLKELFRHFSLPVTISDSVEHFLLAIRSLYPFVVVDGGRVLFAHPIIMGFLAEQGLLSLVTKRNDKVMADLLNLLEKIFDHHGKRVQIFVDPRMDTFKAGNKSQSMYELFSINRRMSLYKSLHQSFSDSTSSMPTVAWKALQPILPVSCATFRFIHIFKHRHRFDASARLADCSSGQNVAFASQQ